MTNSSVVNQECAVIVSHEATIVRFNEPTKGQDGWASLQEKYPLVGVEPRDFNTHHICGDNGAVDCCHADHSHVTPIGFAKLVWEVFLARKMIFRTRTEDQDRLTFARRGRGRGDSARVRRRPCLSGLTRVSRSRLRGGSRLRFRSRGDLRLLIAGCHGKSFMQHLAIATCRSLNTTIPQAVRVGAAHGGVTGRSGARQNRVPKGRVAKKPTDNGHFSHSIPRLWTTVYGWMNKCRS